MNINMRHYFTPRFLLQKNNKKLQIKCRESTIFGPCLHKEYKIYNGKKYINLLVDYKRLGYKFGDFSFSKTYKKKNKNLNLYGKKKH